MLSVEFTIVGGGVDASVVVGGGVVSVGDGTGEYVGETEVTLIVGVGVGIGCTVDVLENAEFGH